MNQPSPTRDKSRNISDITGALLALVAVWLLVCGMASIDFMEPWLPVGGPRLAVVVLGALCVWVWMARKKHPRTARTLLWALGLYLLAGALGWGLLLTSDLLPTQHPEWLGWKTEKAETAAEALP